MHKLRSLLLVAVPLALFVVPAVAYADTYQEYRKCSGVAQCPGKAETNEKGKKIAISISISCNSTGSSLSGTQKNWAKVDKHGRFKATLKTRSFDKDASDYIVNDTEGTMTVSGSIKRKKRVTVNYGNFVGVSPGCTNQVAGVFVVKYSGKTIR
jgi:hypothetical protein